MTPALRNNAGAWYNRDRYLRKTTPAPTITLSRSRVNENQNHGIAARNRKNEIILASMR